MRRIAVSPAASTGAERTTDLAPDYLEPIIGWRSWAVVRRGSEIRLRSIAFTDVWPAREEFVARCYDSVSHWSLRTLWRGPRHSPAALDCNCGIHAASEIRAAAAYLNLYDDVPQRSVCHRALGQVALWGTVVEGDRGWRGSLAYPRRIFLPSQGVKPRVGLEAVVAGLTAYGIRVDVVGGEGQTFIDEVDEVAAQPIA